VSIDKADVAIVGGGLAAAEAAKTLRGDGFDGRIVLVAEERHLPYERPPLSKEYLRGEAPTTKLLAQPDAFYAESSVEVLAGRRAVALDPAERRLSLDDGRTIGFGRLLLATGARPRRLTATPRADEGVHYLRTIEDADRLRAAAADAGTAVVAGGGWIAAESAASLRQLGLDVTLVVPGSQILERSLGPDIGARYGAVHRRHGVRIIHGARVEAVEQDGRARRLRLSSGATIAGDLAVLGLGAAANLELARDAGIGTGAGILVDERLETSVPGIFAAGDVASALHPRLGRRVRSEHWDNARRQGRTAARNLAGGRESYDRVPYFYSDQFELGMELLGDPSGGDEVVVRDLPDQAFVALWLAGGRVVAGMHGNVWDAKKPIDALVAAGASVDPAAVRDPSVPLEELGREEAAA